MPFKYQARALLYTLGWFSVMCGGSEDHTESNTLLTGRKDESARLQCILVRFTGCGEQMNDFASFCAFLHVQLLMISRRKLQ